MTTLVSPLPVRAGRGDRPAPIVADVALPVPIRRTFAYRVPAELAGTLRVGCRVNVSFGSRAVTGFVVGFDPSDAPERLKSVRSIVDEEPLVDEQLLRLTRWIADRTLCSWGEALRAALPGHGTPRRERVLSLGEPKAADLFGAGTSLEDRILTAVAEAEQLPLAALGKALGARPADLREEVERLVRRGELRRAERVTGAAPTASPRIKVVRLAGAEPPGSEPARPAPEGAEAAGSAPAAERAPVQSRVLELLRAAAGVLPLRDLAESMAGSRGAVKRLAEKGLVEVTQEAWEGRAPEEVQHAPYPEPELTSAQEAAARAVIEGLRSGRAATFLLHGVTGSGKTEVYLRAMAEARRLGRQSIFLVPEISLTPQTVSRLRGRFGGRAAVVHSRLQDSERRRIWQGARRGDYDVVLGPRSAVFAPLPDPGLIVIDEEHDGAYKQEDAPRYQARDVAIERARLANGVVVLGSATPDLETYERASSGEMTLLRLPERVSDLPLPEVRLVDLRGTKGIFSQELLGAVADRLTRREQIILFLNRRGFSPFVQCSGCGAAVRCGQCAVTLTFHKAERALRCHYCDHARAVPEECSECGAKALTFRGAGTQRIEEELAERFPQARIARLDSDAARSPGAHERVLGGFLEGEIDVLLGTQMVAKGLDFPRVTLVGVINADTGLHLPDYRSGERTFQLLTQVAGRAGRSALGGSVLIQTRCPDHPCLVAARDHDDAAFRAREMAERREQRYPPFARLASVLVRGADPTRTEQVAEAVRARVAERIGGSGGWVVVLGPVPAPLAQLRGKFRFRLLIKGERREDVREAAAVALEAAPRKSGVEVVVDPDPLDML
ncbi:MAG: replication restart helicase PriA [Candidatus Eiseniibacteriota bacterium]